MFKTVELRIYRKIYFNCLALLCLVIAASLFLGLSGWQYQKLPAQPNRIKDVLLYGMILLAILYSIFRRRQDEKLNTLTEFNEKLVFHRHYFKTRLLWYVLSGIVACILFVIIGQWLFLYFAIFDLAMLLILYPTKSFFKKELDDEEIIFIP